MPPPGRVEDVGGVAEARAARGVVKVDVKAGPGQEVRPLRWSEDRSGAVVVRGGDSAAAELLARRVAGSRPRWAWMSSSAPPAPAGRGR